MSEGRTHWNGVGGEAFLVRAGLCIFTHGQPARPHFGQDLIPRCDLYRSSDRDDDVWTTRGMSPF